MPSWKKVSRQAINGLMEESKMILSLEMETKEGRLEWLLELFKKQQANLSGISSRMKLIRIS